MAGNGKVEPWWHDLKVGDWVVAIDSSWTGIRNGDLGQITHAGIAVDGNRYVRARFNGKREPDFGSQGPAIEKCKRVTFPDSLPDEDRETWARMAQ